MKLRALCCLLIPIALVSAADLDGNWTGELKKQSGKKSGSRVETFSLILNLKIDSGRITGTVVTGGRIASSVATNRGVTSTFVSGRKRNVTEQITSGKLENGGFTFESTYTNKRGEQRTEWHGTFDADTLGGTCTQVGKRREQTFTAKRS